VAPSSWIQPLFNAKDIDALLLTLEHNFSIDATRTSKDVVLLARLN
jgi:hypothetical protein